MTKRKLNEEEKTNWRKNILSFEKQKKFIEDDIKILEFKRDVMLLHNFEQEKTELNAGIKRDEASLKEIDFIIDAGKKQMKEGIEMKKEVKKNGHIQGTDS